MHNILYYYLCKDDKGIIKNIERRRYTNNNNNDEDGSRLVYYYITVAFAEKTCSNPIATVGCDLPVGHKTGKGSRPSLSSLRRRPIVMLLLKRRPDDFSINFLPVFIVVAAFCVFTPIFHHRAYTV